MTKPKCESCPVAGPCRSPAALCRRHAEAPERWRPVVDHVNGSTAPVYPPLATQLANVAKAAGWFVASGLETVSQEEYERRRGICRACPTGRYVEADDRCLACGCHLAIKPWSKAERCPDGHW